MLAVNITTSLHNQDEDRAGDVRACAEKWWTVSKATLTYADELLAVANNTVAGVFTITDWSRDPDHNDKVVFQLTEAPHWQWLVGQESPVTWERGQANPVRKVGGIITNELRSRQPYRIDGSHGWALDVDPDGTTVTVHGPGPGITLTSLRDGTARLAVTRSDAGGGAR
ncbi:MAG: hypothetical protein QOF58_2796 [Pseudonocardiales bacterium]|nr:hypothetical protein [Pseudonocardiales bacterium]